MNAALSVDPVATDSEPAFEIHDLLYPAAYPHPVGEIKVHETHISWVVLTGEYAYKIKKRLKLDFIDTTVLSTRRFLCEEEVRLNKRLAPDLYLDVIEIRWDFNGVHLGGAGVIVDYAVKMKQFAPSQELPSLLARREVTAKEIIALAGRLAEFHRQAPVASHEPFDYVAQLRESVLCNIATLVAHLHSMREFPAMGQLTEWMRNSLHDLHGNFRKRHAGGFVRECHGDLHAHNIVRWQGQLTAFDALEFDPKLRWIDVMNDVAFLVMDLVAYERKDLAFEFLSRYAEQTGDYPGIRLLPFYAVYRALVRAMVDAFTSEQQPTEESALSDRLHARIRTALDFMHPKRPSLFILHGASGSGKSWLSERLVPLVSAVRVRSDLERTRLQRHAEPSALAETGALYTPAANRQTYARLLKCAENCLSGGISVIVDAAFLCAEDRHQFSDLAQRLALPFVIISCTADKAEMARRIVNRKVAGGDPSRATPSILNAQLRSFAPLRGDELAYTIKVDTMQPNPQRAAFATLQAREVNLAARDIAWPLRRERAFTSRAQQNAY